MGILPLEFKPGQTARSLGLMGDETFDIVGLSADMKPRSTLDGSGRETGWPAACHSRSPRC